MGRNASYIAIDDGPLDELGKPESDEEFRQKFPDGVEESDWPRIVIGKVWDALHCTLTGVTAADPIRDNRLSEAVVGVYPRIYDDDDYSIYVSVIDLENLPEILKALWPIDESFLQERFDPKVMKQQRLYPAGIWQGDPEQLIGEMLSAVVELRKFVTQTISDHRHVLATIV